jgi:CIC family chloride channel protein
VLVAGVILAALALASNAMAVAPYTLGPGYRAIGWALDPHQRLVVVGALLLMRAVAVLATVGGGGTGGLFIPLVVEGALLGRILGGLAGNPAGSLFPVLGIAAFLGAGYRTPLTAVMFVAETTGRPGFVVPALLAAVVAQLMMGRRSIAPEQVAARTGHLERRLLLPASAATATDAATVAPTTTAADFVTDVVVTRHQAAAPVVDDDRLVGVVTLSDVGHLPRAQWETTSISEVMRVDHPAGRTTWTLRDAVTVMEADGAEVLPIVDADDRYVGLLTTSAVLALDDLLDQTDDYGPGASSPP